MKRFITFITVLVLALLTMAQAPQKMNFQALVRDASNELVKNKQVTVTVSVTNASSVAVYSETQTVTTNGNGVATMVIGEGTPTQGTFSAIDWANGSYFLQTSIDLGGGASALSSISPLLSVPYALYAEKANVDLSGYYSKTEIDAMLAELESKIGNGGGGGSSLTVKPVLNAMAVDEVTPHTVELSDLLAVTGAAWYKIGNDSKVGFCVGTSANPTIENSVYEDDLEEEGEFSYTYPGLNPNTTYYVRSYAVVTLTDINSNTNTEIVYGQEKSFTTPAVNGTYTYATGAIKGFFSVSDNQRISFSQGNLQYQASTGTWKFADNQYDMIGNNNSNISSSNTGWIDLFGWGTSSYNGKNPYMTSTDYSDYGDGSNDIAGTNYDWGVYNKISNGGNQAGLWRTLTKDEWNYVISNRTDARYLCGTATVNGVNGLILLPDNWTLPTGVTFTYGEGGWSQNTYSASEWSKMEANGAVFLPAAGNRDGTDVYHVGSYGAYWSSSASGSDIADCLYFYGDYVYTNDNYRYYGQSVRLVRGL